MTLPLRPAQAGTDSDTTKKAGATDRQAVAREILAAQPDRQAMLDAAQASAARHSGGAAPEGAILVDPAPFRRMAESIEAEARHRANVQVVADAVRSGAAAAPAAAGGAPTSPPGEWVRGNVVRARFEGRFPTVDGWLREASRNVGVAGADAYMRKVGARWEYELHALEAYFNKCGMLKDPVPVVGGARTIHRCR